MLLQPPGTTAQGLANGSSSTPLFDAEQVYAGELPDVRPHLVPLSFVVERVLAHAYGELSNLIETCASPLSLLLSVNRLIWCRPKQLAVVQ